MDFFIRVNTNSINYRPDHFRNRNFGEMKWININLQEMIHICLVIIWIYILSQNIGGYTSYFE